MSNNTPPPFPLAPLEPYAPPFRPPNERPRFRNRLWVHILLFLLTLATTTLIGAFHYAFFEARFGSPEIELSWRFLAQGLWYSCTILCILGAHEMGHYLLCRRYRVDASLPYFLPAPPPFITGTLGAVIRIREAFPTRTVLFDIGVAGPIGGFLVLVPALFVGLGLSNVVPAPPPEGLISLGEPLLFRLATKLVFGTIADGNALNIHPMVFAAWFGMLATALNLLPFGQLDGGHITYATLGRVSTPISMATVGTAIAMNFMSTSWLFLTVIMIVMLVVLGPRHPRVLYEFEPLGPGRKLVALAALGILALCFTPFPIEPYDLIQKR